MLKSNKIIWKVEERRNTFTKSGKEWALEVNFLNSDVWALKTWSEKPNEIEIKDTANLAIRAMDFYHCHLEIPGFNITLTKWE